MRITHAVANIALEKRCQTLKGKMLEQRRKKKETRPYTQTSDIFFFTGKTHRLIAWTRNETNIFISKSCILIRGIVFLVSSGWKSTYINFPHENHLFLFPFVVAPQSTAKRNYFVILFVWKRYCCFSQSHYIYFLAFFPPFVCCSPFLARFRKSLSLFLSRVFLHEH